MCSVCKKTAATFNLIKGIEGEKLLYDGICGQALFASDPRLVRALQANDVMKAHHLMNRGIDAYCPECEKSYCSTHYVVTQKRDADNCIERMDGTCPRGHKRRLDSTGEKPNIVAPFLNDDQ